MPILARRFISDEKMKRHSSAGRSSSLIEGGLRKGSIKVYTEGMNAPSQVLDPCAA